MMKNNRTKNYTIVAIIAAVVAALTTLAVICLRMRTKKMSRKAFGDTIDYDLDDCCCSDFEADDGAEEPVQIPIAETESDDFSTSMDEFDVDEE